ncbi:Uncharacterized protein HSBGL_1869 [Halapricum desulfuricans]|uniref:Uncharacterized protein n=1 Tax=Halapricum desulfuricans TaxID=2841257 RepID=A0A897NCZ1_9EURY|nr:hypothetical protein [Halapricum desulfuricans]QSG12280.1 Uncharacterized protein HSBGL_1869 [Halapricum desulfuricans]
MTSDPIVDGDIGDPADFEAALRAVLDAALQNDIDPRGSWEHRDGNHSPDWEVLITELQPQDVGT